MNEAALEKKNPAEQAREQARKLNRICESLGFDTEVRSVPEEPESLAIFLYNDAGTLAVTTSAYEEIREQLERNMDDGDQYSYTLENWQDNFPYLKLTPK
jgi:hypothetical protein